MDQYHSSNPSMRPQVPWNKGKLIGAKPPLRPKHVWSIRTKLQVEGELRQKMSSGFTAIKIFPFASYR